jgi:hypothetical protein
MVADIPPPVAAPQPIDPEEQKGFERLIGAIGDVELRIRLLALWRKAHR